MLEEAEALLAAVPSMVRVTMSLGLDAEVCTHAVCHTCSEYSVDPPSVALPGRQGPLEVTVHRRMAAGL